MFDKLFEAQQKAEEIKKRLDTISVSGEAEGGRIRVSATANKHIESISIDTELIRVENKEELEELIAVAVNKALEQAEKISQAEMQAATRDMLGGFGNMFGQ
ncbi:YbaB/EbfC family nucleoid-associated protein (plasmid) [Pedobacter sp. BS3]|uniref:YbaB/EbfC family nucleoid-associated protein n=1 Tax=Pedobacter sp. BS3 TaxID=2567937 RepID=UPI0011EFE271|nr:YbaB/EbfC family nucleoid-associated protein [Pedobacter sp. BS3]TZF85823.1 YbaB/EbfC family nucleoid-associated protein [Pedobacter sp. BS3]